jgi:amino acid transporter
MDTSRTDTDEQTRAQLPIFQRKSTGLVRELGVREQVVFNISGTGTLGIALVFVLTALAAFPQANLYIVIPVALFFCIFLWTTYAVLSATMPRIGGDYTFTTRVVNPQIGFAFNLCLFLSTALSAGIWAYWVATQGLAPVFTVIGAVTHSSTLLSWGAAFTHHWVTFLVGFIALGITTALSIRGTKYTMRVMVVLFSIAAVAWLVGMLILTFTSHATFVHDIDSLGGAGTYAKTAAAGASGGYTVGATIGALYFVMTAIMYVYWGAYISAEFRGANRRKRQLGTMLGAGLVFGLLVYLAVIVLLRTAGHDFLTAAVAGKFNAPGGTAIGTAGYTYFAALIAGNAVIVTILALAFMGWFLPGLYINSAMASRAVFTWAFDGLLPNWFTRVNDRTHTPINAIGVAWVFGMIGLIACAFTSNFLAILGVVLLFNYLPLLFVGVSAAIMSRRRPDLYDGSPADWKIAGVRITPVVGVGTTLVGAGLIFMGFYYRSHLGITSATAFLGLSYDTLEWLLPVVVIAVALIWYYVARALHRRHGVDLGMAYSTIPPD